MKKTKKVRRMCKFITRVDSAGWLLISPFILGFSCFFLVPMMKMVHYSFSKVKIKQGGLDIKFVGFENYHRVFLEDGQFIRALLPYIGEALISVIFIMFFSMFLAMLMKDEFGGRLFFRTVSFLPIIFGSDVAMRMLSGFNESSNAYNTDLSSQSNEFAIFSENGAEFLFEILENFGFGPEILEVLSDNVNNIFNIAWESGIQIVLFIVAFKGIPSYLYEVCNIEGASKWEIFWKVTFPLLTPTILLCVVYSLIVKFNADNEVVAVINKYKTLELHYSAALTVVYSILVLCLFGIVYKLISSKTIYLD